MFTVRVSQEADGRWIGEAPELPGVLAYGASRAEAIRRIEVLVLRVIAERLEAGEAIEGIAKSFTVEGVISQSPTHRVGRCAECGHKLRRWTPRWVFDRALLVGGTLMFLLSLMAMIASLWWMIGYVTYSDKSAGVNCGIVYIDAFGPTSPISSEHGWYVYERDMPMEWWRWEMSAWRFQSPLWFWTLLGAGITTLGVCQARRQQRPGRCPKCGYDLTGLGSGQRCPECGYSFATQPKTVP